MGGRLERLRAPKLMWIKSLCVLVLLAGSGCLSAGSGTGSVDSVGVLWPERGGGTSEDLPPVVMIGRIVFESETGEACCLAGDPDLLMTDLLVLDDLPTGLGTPTPTPTPPAVRYDTTTGTSRGSIRGSRSQGMAPPFITVTPTPTATPPART